MKRFWDQATTERHDGTWRVLLDGKPMRLPGGEVLRLPGGALAEAVAAEWQLAGADGGEMNFADVPLTRIAGTAQERIAPDPDPVILEIARYGESDLLCYRAETPEALAVREHEAWQPWLDWADRRFGAQLRVTSGVVHVAQDAAALAALAQAVATYGPPSLAALGILVPALGSLVLGLAVAEGVLAADEAHALSMLDERFQAELWGEDEQALARQRHVAADIAVAGRFLGLCREPVSLARRLVVSGRVQGVGYRDWLVRRARAANLHGWVRNLPDGSVEALLYGDPANIVQLVRDCHRGPPLAAVDTVLEHPADPPDVAGFHRHPTP